MTNKTTCEGCQKDFKKLGGFKDISKGRKKALVAPGSCQWCGQTGVQFSILTTRYYSIGYFLIVVGIVELDSQFWRKIIFYMSAPFIFPALHQNTCCFKDPFKMIRTGFPVPEQTILSEDHLQTRIFFQILPVLVIVCHSVSSVYSISTKSPPTSLLMTNSFDAHAHIMPSGFFISRKLSYVRNSMSG